MKLALLGADAETLELVRWAVFVGGHQLVAAYDVGLHGGDVAAIAPDVALDEDWESLVLGTRVDAVVVSRALAGATQPTGIADDERRADQFRKLAQAAVPMLVVHPACEAIVGFEIEMIRRDCRGMIVPFVPGEQHPAFAQLAAWLSDPHQSPTGPIEQLLLERQLPDRSRAVVLTQFARDVSLLRRLIGTIRSVSAAGPTPRIGRDPLGPKLKELPALVNLSVSLGGERDAPARWSVAPVTDHTGGKLTLVGAQGNAVLDMPAGNPWTLEIGGARGQTFDSYVDALAAVRRLQEAIDGRHHDAAAWLNACRDQEAAEAIDRSLARGRTIELFNEEHTEDASFKGVMAMGGCLLLLAAVGVVFVATLVEGLRLPLKDWVAWRFWPVYLLVPIGVFLLLQLLQLVVKKDAPNLRQFVGGEDNAG